MKRALALVLTAALCGALTTSAEARTRSITVGDSYFVKKRGKKAVTVRRGDTVRFVWRRTRLPHNVRVRRGPQKFKSKTQRRGTYRKRVRRRGTYRIVCTLHRNMRMTLRVR
jgi:plastocyanin